MTKRLGATPHNGGCEFRVWAWHADRVRVLLQQGDRWDHDAVTQTADLVRDADGYWEADVPEVNVGDLYRFEITNNDLPADRRVLQRLDAAARDVLHSHLTDDGRGENASIVVTDRRPNWSYFRTPWFEDWLIYQLHVGTFAGRNDGFNKNIATFSDVQSKLSFIASLGFNAIELLPIQEFAADRSWGYNPAAFFAIESAYGPPFCLQYFVEMAHQHGLAVIFDVVYNHAGPDDNVLWEYDGWQRDGNGGIYFEGGGHTRHHGPRPAWWKWEVRDYFLQNARMYFDDFNADGLRFDLTGEMDGPPLAEVVGQLRQQYPSKYLIAEHHPADRWITTFGNFCATWQAEAHHEAQRALNGDTPVDRIKGILGWDGFDQPWNLVKYLTGCHDDIGDQQKGNAEHGLSNWDKRHRYLVDLFGGRHNWHARAKARLAWALNIAMPGTPMLFMGTECHMGAPEVGWGYWHDSHDDGNGDHRFDWSIAGDETAMPMRRLVTTANRMRWENPALRSPTLQITHEDRDNGVIAFKRWSAGNVVLAVVNLGDNGFGDRSYRVATGGQFGLWTQILCTQDAAFGGWDGAGNAFYEPETQSDGRIAINLPQWSVVMFRLR